MQGNTRKIGAFHWHQFDRSCAGLWRGGLNQYPAHIDLDSLTERAPRLLHRIAPRTRSLTWVIMIYQQISQHLLSRQIGTMNSMPLKSAVQNVGLCSVLVFFVVLLTLVFSFLGTIICAALAGMMMGATRPSRWLSVPTAM